MSQSKISIRFFDDREVRAVWDEQNARWWFSVIDVVAVLTRFRRPSPPDGTVGGSPEM
ncbi:MAG TPA: hypothetical protein PKY63_03025 [Bacteroidales bacterium]|nr:hypothetical protein [Bacteroidales bacterium]